MEKSPDIFGSTTFINTKQALGIENFNVLFNALLKINHKPTRVNAIRALRSRNVIYECANCVKKNGIIKKDAGSNTDFERTPIECMETKENSSTQTELFSLIEPDKFLCVDKTEIKNVSNYQISIHENKDDNNSAKKRKVLKPYALQKNNIDIPLKKIENLTLNDELLSPETRTETLRILKRYPKICPRPEGAPANVGQVSRPEPLASKAVPNNKCVPTTNIAYKAVTDISNLATPNKVIPNIVTPNKVVPNIVTPNKVVPNIGTPNRVVPNIGIPNVNVTSALAPRNNVITKPTDVQEKSIFLRRIPSIPLGAKRIMINPTMLKNAKIINLPQYIKRSGNIETYPKDSEPPPLISVDKPMSNGFDIAGANKPMNRTRTLSVDDTISMCSSSIPDLSLLDDIVHSDLLNSQDTPDVPTYNTLAKQMVKEWNQCDKLDKNGYAPIHHAVLENNIFLLKRQCTILVDKNISLDIVDSKNQTALQLAILNNSKLYIVDYLIKSQLDIEVVDDGTGNNLLHLATIHCTDDEIYTIIVHKLISKINDFNDEGYAPVHLAVLHQSIAKLLTLLNYKADIDIQDPRNGKTPLFYAVEMNNFLLVETLLKRQADVYIPNFAQMTVSEALLELDNSNAHIVSAITRATSNGKKKIQKRKTTPICGKTVKKTKID